MSRSGNFSRMVAMTESSISLVIWGRSGTVLGSDRVVDDLKAGQVLLGQLLGVGRAEGSRGHEAAIAVDGVGAEATILDVDVVLGPHELAGELGLETGQRANLGGEEGPGGDHD